jgi:hypothetical protein
MLTYIHTFEHTYIHTHTHTHTHKYSYTYIIHAYTYSYICKYIYYVCTYIHTYIHTHTHTHTQAGTKDSYWECSCLLSHMYYCYMGTAFGQALRVCRQHNDKGSALTVPKIRVANIQRLNTPKKLIVLKLIRWWLWWWWWWRRRRRLCLIMILHNDDDNNDDGNDNDESKLWRNKTKSFKYLLQLQSHIRTCWSVTWLNSVAILVITCSTSWFIIYLELPQHNSDIRNFLDMFKLKL